LEQYSLLFPNYANLCPNIFAKPMFYVEFHFDNESLLF
jgi:hypothetical protein